MVQLAFYKAILQKGPYYVDESRMSKLASHWSGIMVGSFDLVLTKRKPFQRLKSYV